MADASYNPVPKCRICQNRHWLKDGCAGDFQKRFAPKPTTPPAPRAKVKKSKGRKKK